ncbi:glucosamine-6-phosphate deaminase [Enterococcus sp. PF1-24]|uniref:glucosamine-6-phosphate deaminase n=1 Tax=unclassified Enterococcus TaxID=2608891 RepID=UPI002475FC4A|nr:MULTISPECIES: glucosamine-6-phosphate deaminase [unclassified Enterococcus]MDH6363555.1 glucosamine-6-phosphate deaminase [Enterococcus sp. PFB1-1]MDH6400790.1 glucosamine-6-phosphate deaminase [Enterococcus sp. PF1-24]
MEIIRVKDALEGGQKAYELIQTAMTNGAKVLGLATGSTPEGLYASMVASDTDYSDMTSINLDEYVGLGIEDEQSYRTFMNQQLFNQKPFKETFVPNGKATDLQGECQRYNQVIAEHPIDLQILGIGQNGHIGFNEPGTSFDSETQVVELTESTINANKRYFEKVEDVPTKAISMGIASIMTSKKIVLMAFGEAKADAIAGMINGPLSEDLPASALQKHNDVVVILDDAAAAKL